MLYAVCWGLIVLVIVAVMLHMEDRRDREKIAAVDRRIAAQEPWTEMRSEVKPLLYSLMGWVAEQESRRISERTKAGMERARAQGAKIGRPKGKKDARPRRKAERRPVWE